MNEPAPEVGASGAFPRRWTATGYAAGRPRGQGSNGPAARAGVRQWDVITKADGQTVRLPDELLRLIRAKTPGDTVSLTLLSPDGAGTRQLEVRLGKLEVGWPASSE